MSIDYYIRLEQARGPRPSKQVLAALARALLLTADERAYLFHLAGEAPPLSSGPSRNVPAAILTLLDALTDTPAYVMDARYDILAWNRLATHLIGDLTSVPERDRNVIRWAFTSPQSHVDWDDPHSVAFVRASVADLRAALARYPGDRGIQELVTELLAASPRFAAMWGDHEVAVRRSVTKRLDHPLVGSIEASCQVLHIPDTDQRLVLYVAAPGTPFHEALQRLRALDGRERSAVSLDPDPHPPTLDRVGLRPTPSHSGGDTPERAHSSDSPSATTSTSPTMSSTNSATARTTSSAVLLPTAAAVGRLPDGST